MGGANNMNPWALKMLTEAWEDKTYSFERVRNKNFGQMFPQAGKKYPYLANTSVGDLPKVTIPGSKHTIKSTGAGIAGGAALGGLFAFGEGIKRKFPVIAGTSLITGALAGGLKHRKISKQRNTASSELAKYQTGKDEHSTYRPISSSDEYQKLAKRNLHIKNKKAELMHKTVKGKITNKQARQEIELLKKKYGRI